MMSQDDMRGQGGMPGLFPRPGGPGAGMGQLSPYLNIDPSYLNTNTPEYIFDTETKRGKLEKSFTGIGGSVCIGSGVGSTYGLLNGVRQTAGLQGAVRRSQIMNHVLKSGGLVGNALGTVAVSYSVMHCLLAYVPAIEDNDEAKSIISGTATGLFFKSTSGLQKCARGGLIGLGLSTLWALGLKKQETIQHYI